MTFTFYFYKQLIFNNLALDQIEHNTWKKIDTEMLCFGGWVGVLNRDCLQIDKDAIIYSKQVCRAEKVWCNWYFQESI